MLETATRVPLSANRVLIDSERLVRLLDQLRPAIPEEIRQAKEIIQERDDILSAADDQANSLIQEGEQTLNDARREAEAIIAEASASAQSIAQQAEQEAQHRIATHEIVRKAEERAVKIIEDSQRRADEARADADEYIFEVLNSLESELNRLLAVTRRGRSTLRRANALHAQQPSAQPEPVAAGQVIPDDAEEDGYIDEPDKQ